MTKGKKGAAVFFPGILYDLIEDEEIKKLIETLGI